MAVAAYVHASTLYTKCLEINFSTKFEKHTLPYLLHNTSLNVCTNILKSLVTVSNIQMQQIKQT